MTNRIKYQICVNGRVVKSGIGHVDNKDFKSFEQEKINEACVSLGISKNDRIEFLFR